MSIHNVMRSHSQISCITIDNWWLTRWVTMYKTIDAITYSQMVCSYNKRCVLTLFNRAYFVDSCYKDCTINTRIYQDWLNCRINVNVRLFTILNTQTHLWSKTWVDLLICLLVNTFIQIIYLIKIFLRLNYC